MELVFDLLAIFGITSLLIFLGIVFSALVKGFMDKYIEEGVEIQKEDMRHIIKTCLVANRYSYGEGHLICDVLLKYLNDGTIDFANYQEELKHIRDFRNVQ